MPVERPETLPPSLRRYVFSVSTMQSIVGGASAIDVPRLRLRDRDEGVEFLKRYGYDLARADDVADLERVRHESLAFLEHVLLVQVDDLDVPRWLTTTSILELLMIAADDPRRLAGDALVRQAWACGLLRVMHTVAHADNYFQQQYYPQIRREIIDRFVQQVRTDDNGKPWLRATGFDVPLERFEVKETKPLHSVVLKLLQKEENVAYDLFDHIGVRIIVPRPIDALFAIRALRESHTIIYPNIKPTRSRNTLVDFDAFDAHVRATIARWRAGELDEVAAIKDIEDFNARPSAAPQLEWNRFSSTRYASIQFTCRQMIRFPNPLHERLREAQELARTCLDGEALREMTRVLSLEGVPSEMQFFFPYEVQILDKPSYEAATEGRAAYGEYKARQRGAARSRVLGPLFAALGRQDVLGAPVSDRPPEVAPVRLRPARQTIVTEAIDRAALEAVTAADG